MPTDDVRTFIRDDSGRILASSADLQTNACCATGAPPAWIARRLENMHSAVSSRFFGCGTGRDVYGLAQLARPAGQVYALDMTEAQFATARATEAWHAERFGFERPNTTFRSGYIEDLAAAGFAAASVDVEVSNCVINPSPRKGLVLAEAFRVLAPGGELYFSDVVADRRLPADVAADPLLHAECLGGALYAADLGRSARRAGFGDPRLVSRSPITIRNGVCGNTADTLSPTRFSAHFGVSGNRRTHFGLFPCGPTLAAEQSARERAPAGGSCC